MSRAPAPVAKAGTRPRKALADSHAKPAGQWHHGDLRAALIACGTHLLDTEGIAGMSMRAAARLAGVSPGAPAHHFGDSAGLLAAIAAQAFRDMVALRMKKLAAVAADDVDGRLRAVILGYVEFAQKHPARFHLMFGRQFEYREKYPELLQESGASFEVLKSAVAPLLSAEQTAVFNEAEVAFAVWAATHGLATLSVDRRRVQISPKLRLPAEQMTEIVVQFCLAAIKGIATTRAARQA